MVVALLTCVLLSQTPDAAQVEQQQLKLAAPGLEAVDLDPKKAEFLNNFFAEQLGKKTDERVRVITQSEVAALIGLERQKQLLGCSESSAECLAEISGALGVDALIVGNVARFGSEYAVTVRVLPAGGGVPLASASGTNLSEERLLAWMRTTSSDFAKQLDPGAPARSQTQPVVKAPEHKNALRFAFASVEYSRRLRGPSWVGGRVTGWALGHPGLASHSMALAMARFDPTPPGATWNYGLFTGVGVSHWWFRTKRRGESHAAVTLGVEGGYQGLRASVEVLWTYASLSVIPGLSFAVTF